MIELGKWLWHGYRWGIRWDMMGYSLFVHWFKAWLLHTSSILFPHSHTLNTWSLHMTCHQIFLRCSLRMFDSGPFQNKNQFHWNWASDKPQFHHETNLPHRGTEATSGFQLIGSEPPGAAALGKIKEQMITEWYRSIGWIKIMPIYTDTWMISDAYIPWYEYPMNIPLSQTYTISMTSSSPAEDATSSSACHHLPGRSASKPWHRQQWMQWIQKMLQHYTFF